MRRPQGHALRRAPHRGECRGRRAETAGLRRMLHLPPGIVHVILFSNR
ncbi:hypothetical protein DA2_3168 [Desulfovibrio sp. A2]|nr:hypothetical protein DA2_3168 [Desulfovibrio sp. A2]